MIEKRIFLQPSLCPFLIGIVSLFILFLGCFHGMAYGKTASGIVNIDKEDLAWIGETIFQKECGGKKEFLLAWNKGEDFPSLGIGHFIWYPQGMEGPFEESFPAFLNFARQRGVQLPVFIDSMQNMDCPWTSRRQFYRARNADSMKSLYTFLMNTKYEQTLFIVTRLKTAIPKIMEAAPYDKKEHIKNQFFRVADSSRKLYALIDYVNFKGEGIKSSERYKNQGWGLLQVLEEMKGTKPGTEAIHEFVRAAETVLVRRVVNAPVGRNEHRWLPGWKNRINDYKLLATLT